MNVNNVYLKSANEISDEETRPGCSEKWTPTGEGPARPPLMIRKVNNCCSLALFCNKTSPLRWMSPLTIFRIETRRTIVVSAYRFIEK